MNTICRLPDIDIYLLYYLSIENIDVLACISKSQYELLGSIPFVQEFYMLRRDNCLGKYVIDYAAEYGYLSLIKWSRREDESINNFLYTEEAINSAA